MSIDLDLYTSRKDVIPKEELATALRALDWEVRYTKTYSPSPTVLSESVEVLPSVGPLENGVFLVGWKAENQEAFQFDRFFPERGWTWMEERADLGYAGCYIDAEEYDIASEFMSAEEMAELEISSPQYVEALKNAHFSYTVTTYAGRSESTPEFRDIVWRTLGRLCGGVLHDSLDGETVFVEAERELP